MFFYSVEFAFDPKSEKKKKKYIYLHERNNNVHDELECFFINIGTSHHIQQKVISACCRAHNSRQANPVAHVMYTSFGQNWTPLLPKDTSSAPWQRGPGQR